MHEILLPTQPFQAPIPALLEVTDLIRADVARKRFAVDGAGLCVAVLDTGINAVHVSFEGRVVAQADTTGTHFSEDANDLHGHGTNVGGIIAGGRFPAIGLAPAAGIAAVKVLGPGATWGSVARGLIWVAENAETYKISAVCMSFQDAGNYRDTEFLGSAAGLAEIAATIRGLNVRDIVTVAASGNHFYGFNSEQGMAFPAILPEVIGVGAVFDSDDDMIRYGGLPGEETGAVSYRPKRDHVAPFSQRLHQSVAPSFATDIFAPGSPVTSAGLGAPTATSTQDGTSQAAPVIAGTVLLLQQYHLRMTGRLPSADKVREAIVRGSVTVVDGDDEDDNVTNTGCAFQRVDVLLALQYLGRSLGLEMMRAEGAI